MIKSGVYKITNTINNKCYVGSSSNIKARKNDHWCLFRKKKHPNLHLQSSVNKYGLENFTFKVIEICVKTDITIREQFWIDLLKPDYNIRNIAMNNFGLRHTLSTKLKISVAAKNMWKKTGMREQLISNRCKPLVCYTRDGNFYKLYSSTREAALELDIEPSHITKILKGKANLRKGFTFTYYVENYPQFIDLSYIYERKISTIQENAKCNRKKVEVIIDDKSIGVFESLNEASKSLNVHFVTLTAIKNGKYKLGKSKYDNWKIIES